MVGLFPDVTDAMSEHVARKRKTEEIVKEGIRMEEKKLRVEQVVTALTNTETKKKQINKNDEKKENSLASAATAKCTCGAGTSMTSHTPQYYSHTVYPSTNVTFALRPKVSLKEYKTKKHHGEVQASKDNPPPFFQHFLIQQSLNQPLMKFGSVPPPIISSGGVSGSSVLSPPQHVQGFYPVLRASAAPRGSHCSYKNIDIIRVPRDNKTPFVVFKPGPRPAGNQGRPRLPRSLPPSNTIQSISLPSNMTPSCIPTLVVSAAAARPAVPVSMPKLFAHGHVPGMDLNYSLSQHAVRDVDAQKWAVKLHQTDDHVVAPLSQRSYLVDSSDQVKDELMKYPDRLSMWTIHDVHEYFRETDCSQYADVFKSQEIDGRALLLLDEITISRLLEVKMGPAIKLTALIKALIDRMAE